MASRALNLLREHVGVDAGPDLVVAVSEMPLGQLGELAELILTGPAGSSPKPPSVTEVWPVTTLRGSTFASGGVYRDAAGPAGLNLNASLNPRFAGTGKFSAGVLRALLYCHGLVIEDPIIVAADMYTGTKAELRAVARLAVVSAVTSIVEIAPLLDSDVVRTFFSSGQELRNVQDLRAAIGGKLSEAGAAFSVADAWEAFEAGYIDGLSPPLQELWRRVRSGDRNPPLELVEQGVAAGDVDIVETFITVLKDLRPKAVIDNAVETIATSVLAVEGLGGFYDLLCPSPLFAKLLFLGAPDPSHELRLHELGRVAVPGIDRLDVLDAVRIRQASDALADWRDELSQALETAHRLRAHHASADEIQAAVRDHVAHARAELQREAKKSKLLNGLNPISFLAGALGGTIAGSTGGTAGMTAGAVGGTIGPLVQAILNSRKTPGYLERHYLVFEPITV
jgi:hypothetical protein